MKRNKSVIVLIVVITVFVVTFVVAFEIYWHTVLHQKIFLPDIKDVSSVVISYDNDITVTDEIIIENILVHLENVTYTSLISANDVPSNVAEYIKITFDTNDEVAYTFYLYQDGDEYYVEQPYQGIYGTNKQLYEMVMQIQ